MQLANTAFGDWLRERRRSLDMTREDLAGRVGCSWATIKKIETGERRPSKQIAQLLADALEIDQEEREAFLRLAREEAFPVTSKREAHPSGGPDSSVPERRAASGQRSPSALHNLPSLLTPLLGREELVGVVSRAMRDEAVRLYTITGPPGIGKTRLALEVARQLLPCFPDGVYFVALDSVHEAGMMVSTLAQVLELTDTHDTTPVAMLSKALKGRNLLLLLDNFEQIVEGASLIAHVLESTPGLKVMATSLAPLHLRGEQQMSLPALELPDIANLPPLEELARYSAIQLFVERAQAVRADFALTQENAPAVARICAELDGLPLGIELIAARTRVLSPQALLDHLLGAYDETRLQMLTSGPRDLPPRHRALSEAISWSYNLLPPGEQELFARLSVFAGGCGLDAVQSMCLGLGGSRIEALDGVQSLVDKSLLREAPGSEIEPRFIMLGTIREFAREKLDEKAESATLYAWHTGHYTALAEAAEPQLSGSEQKLWVDRLSLEHDNFRAALRWALDLGGRSRSQPGWGRLCGVSG